MEDTVIVITEQQRAELDKLAIARESAHRPEDTGKVTDIFTGAQTNALGLYGEFAAAQYLGGSIDRTISRYGDNGVDMVLEKFSIAVKFNHTVTGYLIVQEDPKDRLEEGFIYNLQTDIIVFTRGKCLTSRCFCKEPVPLTVDIKGWLRREEFLAEMRRVDWGYGPRYVCRADQLRPMPELLQLVKSAPSLMPEQQVDVGAEIEVEEEDLSQHWA